MPSNEPLLDLYHGRRACISPPEWLWLIVNGYVALSERGPLLTEQGRELAAEMNAENAWIEQRRIA